MHIAFENTALIYDEALLELVKVLEQGEEFTPSTMHALDSLCEAAVLHERVYFDPLHRLAEDSTPKGKLESLLRESTFVRNLVGTGVLSKFHHPDDVDAALAAGGSDYRMIDFVAESLYTGASFAALNATAERKTALATEFLVTHLPEVFGVDRLINPFSTKDVAIYEDPIAIKAASMGYEPSELMNIMGAVHRAKAYTEFSARLGIQVYPPLLAIPFQFGAIRAADSRARKLYEKVVTNVTAADEVDPLDPVFARVRISPLTQILMERCGNSTAGLVAELVELRDQHSTFRASLTTYEREWARARVHDTLGRGDSC